MSKLNLKLTLPIALTVASLMGATMVATAQSLSIGTHLLNTYSTAQSLVAPIGIYSAQTGGTSVTGRLTRICRDANCPINRRLNRSNPTTAPVIPITIAVDSFSPASEIQSIQAAGIGNFSKAINNYRHGKVTYEGVSYPINLATYRNDVNGNYFLRLISTKPFAKAGEPITNSVKGNTVSMIELSVPKVGSAGNGKLYQSIQVSLSKSGEILGQGGATSTTILNMVLKS